ncbi:MAG: ATP phosphoribosyltransferase [Gammaproteobacteria bacterium]|jgi:ATP phosphoribosyltransferase|nr:ATP phosphoribosyltransferase [Gammaproteobacteria bacterium]HJN96106.1 ATP phosphoribosyltransferase [Gammaproteobacteria bacterium]|tara:strand:+ start:702 stop:1340 length:639 start_codon:yes stop_codon:yes gene_type:complete
MNSSNLVIALTKGRILEETLPLFQQADIVPEEDVFKSRKLLFDTNQDNVKLMVIRGSDVPTYVEFGSADMGVAGKDLILEYGSEGFYEPLDLQIAACRLMTAEPVNPGPMSDCLKVATKFTHIAKKYFAEQGKQIELIKLNGALELAPSLGLADAIVDIVDTGKTLEANNLEPKELIANISARVIVNKASMKIKNAIIRQILGRLRDAVESN